MSTIYFVFGFLQAITGYICYVFKKQESFKFEEKSYDNIGKNPTKIVVYFSRKGYTKKIALEEANQTGAKILELKTNEKIEGSLGFLWCGRFGMHGWSMNIDEIKDDLSKYEKVTICTPIWVFGMASPVNEFCKIYSGKLKKVDYIFVHFMKAKFIYLAEKIDNILKTKRTEVKTICCRMGEVKSKKVFKN